VVRDIEGEHCELVMPRVITVDRVTAEERGRRATRYYGAPHFLTSLVRDKAGSQENGCRGNLFHAHRRHMEGCSLWPPRPTLGAALTKPR